MADSGDPVGRRPATKKAAILAEAGRVARALEVLIKRANWGTALIGKLTEDLGREELRQLQLAHGKIEARRRFGKHSSQPLLDQRPVHNLYLDESGKSSVEPVEGPSYFALSGIGMADEAVPQYQKAADDLKKEFFGTVNITFHESSMRNFDGPYYFNGDKQRQLEFDQAIDQLLLDTDFVVFGAGIRKHAFEQDFVATGLDPYLPTDAYSVAITMLLERYVDFLALSEPDRIGRLTFEQQGSREDAEHQLEYARLLLEGSQWIPDSVFRNWLETGLHFVPKAGSHPCELADMFARELYEWIKGDCDVSPKRWGAFSKKIYCREDGSMGKFGVKIFPDSDVRDLILDHRKRHGARV